MIGQTGRVLRRRRRHRRLPGGADVMQLHATQRLIDSAKQQLDVRLPFGYLGLARTGAKAGDTATERTAYQDLLVLWKDADPDLPAVRAARQEYAALK